MAAAEASFSYKIGGGGLIFLQNWRRQPHFPTKLAAAASFSYKIGGSGKDLATLLAAVLTWSGYWSPNLVGICWFKSNCIDIKAWLDHHSLLIVSQIKWTLKYLSIRYILRITRYGIISTNLYLFKPPACSIFRYGGPPPTLASLINISNNYTIIIPKCRLAIIHQSTKWNIWFYAFVPSIL